MPAALRYLFAIAAAALVGSGHGRYIERGLWEAREATFIADDEHVNRICEKAWLSAKLTPDFSLLEDAYAGMHQY